MGQHENRSNADLAAAMADGDADALSELYRRHAALVLSIARGILASGAEAEELCQEVFMEAWRRAPQFDAARGSVHGWLARITRSRSIDALRASKSRGAGRTLDIDDMQLHASEHARPDTSVQRGQDRRWVQSAVAELSPLLRSAVELSFFNGMSHSEIASALDLPVGTVKSRMAAAMTCLRRSAQRTVESCFAYEAAHASASLSEGAQA